jgi:hypothetical protein
MLLFSIAGCTTRSTRRVPPTSPRSSSRSTRTCASWAAAASTAAATSSSPEETCSPRARVSQVKPSKVNCFSIEILQVQIKNNSSIFLSHKNCKKS